MSLKSVQKNMVTVLKQYLCLLDGQHRQLRSFLECIDDNFVLQVKEKTMRRSTVLDLILSDKERLVEIVKLNGSLGCRDQEMVQFRILMAMRREHSKLAILDFGRRDFGLFKGLLGRVP